MLMVGELMVYAGREFHAVMMRCHKAVEWGVQTGEAYSRVLLESVGGNIWVDGVAFCVVSKKEAWADGGVRKVIDEDREEYGAKYEDLHMYELQHPSPVLEWIDDHHVCIACHLPGGRTEIQELSLPLKLLAEEGKSLSKDRDFKVISGGFNVGCITGVKHLEGERKIITAEAGSNSVALWTLGDGSSGGLIQKVRTFTNSCPQIYKDHCAVLAVNSSQVAFGSSVNDLCVADTQHHQLVFSRTGVHFLEPSVLMIGFKHSHQISLIDIRTKLQPEDISPADSNLFYDFSVDGDAVYQVSSNMQLSVRDLRNPSTVVAHHNLKQQTTPGTCVHIQVISDPFAQCNNYSFSSCLGISLTERSSLNIRYAG
ncbi:hypothetical protein CAPTEDRAFT_209253 [Capitella teleta]|uniref:Uncharacterized protein n=1 Tax=Capitella teleta TaxID=283909 RepID=R7U707_CAPTE|nr:hypothetical protein CAPTEDRAFT_209253 [Capitella teleta]|eukprot:ELU02150.1 hypothetical protein CAPTEDRAFT_209253 [Capitella teleta]